VTPTDQLPTLETPEQFGWRVGLPAKGVNRLAREGKLGAGLYRVGRYHRIDPITALAALRDGGEDA
jgi:hypothetical protein